jgi:hypothetical protein
MAAEKAAPGADGTGGGPATVPHTAHILELPMPMPEERSVSITEDEWYEFETWRQARPGVNGRLGLLAEVQAQRLRKEAKAILDAEDRQPFLTVRKRRTIAEFMAEPQQTPILADVLAPEMNLLGGPPGQGKSLLARDWAMSVATAAPWQGHAVPEARNVLWVASEGLHDTRVRFGTHALIGKAKDRIWIEDAVNLTVATDVEWLLTEYADLRPGLVVFDVIYGMGMTDDNGTKDALPVINSMKRLSAEWGCATLALGHPPHSGGRRFRGTSMWRDLAYAEWHMADGLLTCEKSKIADAARHRLAYTPEYPALRWKDRAEVRGQEEERQVLLALDVETYPSASIRDRAARLHEALGMGESTARKFIAKHAKD